MLPATRYGNDFACPAQDNCLLQGRGAELCHKERRLGSGSLQGGLQEAISPFWDRAQVTGPAVLMSWNSLSCTKMNNDGEDEHSRAVRGSERTDRVGLYLRLD